MIPSKQLFHARGKQHCCQLPSFPHYFSTKPIRHIIKQTGCARAHHEGQPSAVGDEALLQSLETNSHLRLTSGHPANGTSQQQQEHAAHQHAQPKPCTSTSPVSGVSWQQWLAFFEEADSASDRSAELAVALKDAVRREEYHQAARYKAEMMVLEEQDALAMVQRQLQSALAEERYSDAATLSQGGMTGLQGWWAGQAEDDPVGHLLHIRQDYSRWTARVFRPRDIAEMKVNKSHGFGRPLAQPPPAAAKPVGSPIFEVFVRSKSKANASGVKSTQYLHQPVSLQLPFVEEVHMFSHGRPQLMRTTGQGRVSGGGAVAAGTVSPVVRLSVSIRHDGTAQICPLPPKTMPSTGWPRTWPTKGRTGEAAARQEMGHEDVVDIASQNAMSSLEEGEDPASMVTIVSDSGQDSSMGRARLGQGLAGSRYSSSNLNEPSAELVRIPARIELVNRDTLVYHVPDHHPGWIGRPEAGAGARSRGGKATGATLDEPDSLEAGASHFEVIVPIVQTSQEEASSMASAREDPVQMETLNILADQVAQSMEAKVGHAAPREEIAQAMHEVVRRVASGEPVSSINICLSSSSSSTATNRPSASSSEDNVSAAQLGETTSIMYKRIATDHPRTDPLSGLYLGSFGPHGPELLQLVRTMVDGEEMVQATKLTGDANVPAGLVSFRAKVGRKHRLDGRDVYPDELSITARYRGEGRVAQKGFSQPRWVDGELLVFNNPKSNPLTAGAQLGFVWAVPGEKRFLILLNRMDLS